MYKVGILSDKTINFSNESIYLCEGKSPSLSINSKGTPLIFNFFHSPQIFLPKGNIIVVFENNDQLHCCIGILKGIKTKILMIEKLNKQIKWGKVVPFGEGKESSVGITEEDTIIITYS